MLKILMKVSPCHFSAERRATVILSIDVDNANNALLRSPAAQQYGLSVCRSVGLSVCRSVGRMLQLPPINRWLISASLLQIPWNKVFFLVPTLEVIWSLLSSITKPAVRWGWRIKGWGLRDMFSIFDMTTERPTVIVQPTVQIIEVWISEKKWKYKKTANYMQ